MLVLVLYSFVMYTVKQLAEMAKVSVRTLHYYDEIGLLKPFKVQANGYRSYGEEQLVKLQQILFFRELEFSLDQMKRMFESPRFDPVEALKDQQKLLDLKIKRLKGLQLTILNTIQKMQNNQHQEGEELYGGFTQKQIEEYKDEVRKKYGDKALNQSEERMKQWNKNDYDAVQQEHLSIAVELVKLMDQDHKSDAVQAVVARHHHLIQKFYDCPFSMYRGLGKMYVEDPRFTAFYDKHKVGLAQFLCDAIAHYCDVREKI